MSMPSTGNRTEQALIELLRKKFGGQPQPADELAVLEIDSLGMAELSLELERLFDVRIDESILDARTVAELARYIDRRRTRAGRGA